MDRQRFYRQIQTRGDLLGFEVRYRESDLHIRAERALPDEASASLIRHRNAVEGYIRSRPEFGESLIPLADDPLAPRLVRNMLESAAAAEVGPMAAVAGAIAEAVGRELLETCGEVIVENGGDLFVACAHDIVAGLYAGSSPLSHRIGLKIRAEDMPLGICTSSRTVGHSLSLGRADAACVVADNSALADACATALGNRIGESSDIERALDWVCSIDGVRGGLVILSETMGILGDIEIANLDESIEEQPT